MSTEKMGKKFDQGKAPMDLLPYESLYEVARVLGFGEKKYDAGNWANGIEMRRLLSAAYRHMGQYNSGQDVDEESEISHLAHAACNLLFAIWMEKNRPDLDNRWIKSISNKHKVVPSEELFDLLSDKCCEVKITGHEIKTNEST